MVEVTRVEPTHVMVRDFINVQNTLLLQLAHSLCLYFGIDIVWLVPNLRWDDFEITVTDGVSFDGFFELVGERFIIDEGVRVMELVVPVSFELS